jgi:hypothetical protein
MGNGRNGSFWELLWRSKREWEAGSRSSCLNIGAFRACSWAFFLAFCALLILGGKFVDLYMVESFGMYIHSSRTAIGSEDEDVLASGPATPLSPWTAIWPCRAICQLVPPPRLSGWYWARSCKTHSEVCIVC